MLIELIRLGKDRVYHLLSSNTQKVLVLGRAFLAVLSGFEGSRL